MNLGLGLRGDGYVEMESLLRPGDKKYTCKGQWHGSKLFLSPDMLTVSNYLYRFIVLTTCVRNHSLTLSLHSLPIPVKSTSTFT